MDLAARLGGEAQTPRMLAVAAYQPQPGAPARYGALLLASLPIAISVSDAQACALPEQPLGWGRLALSCFEHHGEAIPILHLGRIFSRPDAPDDPS
jgi:hypothetical protein